MGILSYPAALLGEKLFVSSITSFSVTESRNKLLRCCCARYDTGEVVCDVGMFFANFGPMFEKYWQNLLAISVGSVNLGSHM